MHSEQVHETTLEIDLGSLKKNILFLKSKLASDTKFMAVVKASSYGGGSEIISKYMEEEQLADSFAVAYTHEGRQLRKSEVFSPIMVLHPQSVNFKEIIYYLLEPTLYSTRILKQFVEFCEKHKIPRSYPVHIKCNTGLNRLGMSLSEIKEHLSLLKSPYIKIQSVYSHLAASEDLNLQDFTLTQIEKFEQFKQFFEKEFEEPITYHICNTSGILNYPMAHYNQVRSGIGMYGYGNDERFRDDLTPIASLKSVISQIHNLQEGDSLGYNQGFIATKKTKTATIPVGHADGINRIYGKGKGFVYIHDTRCPILGNVCMDMIMVDITEVECQEGDEVIIFDKNHNADKLAVSAGTISYELITSMSRRIKRVYKR